MSGGQMSSGGQKSGLQPNIASLLCYLCPPITAVIFLVIEKEDPDVRFHAWQGTSLGVAFFAIIVALRVVAAILGAIASIFGVIIGFFIPLVWLASIILWVICLIKAYQGERWRIPYIGDFAAKKAGV